MGVDRAIDFLVVIPTCDRPEFLLAAIRGVLTQPDVSTKIIVVDDSAGGSAACVVQAIGRDIIYLRTPEPTGGWPSKVRNYGLNAAVEMGLKPLFVHFLDDDDIPVDCIYSTVKGVFDARPDAGVVFGTLLPFCDFSSDAVRRKLQEEQLQKVREWRARTNVVNRIYNRVNAFSRLLGQWLYRQHARYSHELFLCSGGMIRYKHAVELGGFDPNTRITEDHEFYTRAIIKFGAHFLSQPSALYRVGSAESLWNPLGLEADKQKELDSEFGQILERRQSRLRHEMGFRFYGSKILFKLIYYLLHEFFINRLKNAEMRVVRQ